MKPRTMMIIAKAAFFLLIMYSLIHGSINDVLFNSIVFLGSFIFTYLGTYDPEYYKIDAASNGLFALSSLLVITGLVTYNNPYFGFDKIMHFAAGVIIAWLGYTILKSHTTNRKMLLFNAITFAIAIGACWELFEFAFDNMPGSLRVVSLGYADSMLDILADTLGAMFFAAMLFAISNKKQRKESKKASRRYI